MIAKIEYKGVDYQVDLSKPIDVSIPLRDGDQNPSAFHAPPVVYEPLKAGDFIGSVKAGSPVNFYNIKVNPHGNGTHTECVGHISDLGITINKTLGQFFFPAQLITLLPESLKNGDELITDRLISFKLDRQFPEALLIRTLPNDQGKLTRNYNGSNPPYLHYRAAEFLAQNNILHLLIDLPSVDREQDDGKMLAHKAYWQYPDSIRRKATISELIYVPDEVEDGFYFLNLQITSMELDVSPSKPVLYRIISN